MNDTIELNEDILKITRGGIGPITHGHKRKEMMDENKLLKQDIVNLSKRISKLEGDMPCKCLNSEGELANICSGICKIQPIVDEEFKKQFGSLNGFAEIILSQVDKMIDNKLNKFHVNLEKKWSVESREIFIEGLRHGYKLRKEMEDEF